MQICTIHLVSDLFFNIFRVDIFPAAILFIPQNRRVNVEACRLKPVARFELCLLETDKVRFVQFEGTFQLHVLNMTSSTFYRIIFKPSFTRLLVNDVGTAAAAALQGALLGARGGGTPGGGH